MGHQYPFINYTPAKKVSCLKKHNGTFTIKLPLTIKLKLLCSNYFTKRAFAKSQAVLHAQTKKKQNITLLQYLSLISHYLHFPFLFQDTFLCFTGTSKPIKENFLENTIVGHTFLVDCNGLVRWKAHANPTDEEIKFMLDCSKLLLKDTKKTLRKNNITSNRR